MMRSFDTQALIAAQAPGAVLCTLIGVEGGFSRAPGAQLAVAAEGALAGDMTGGCLEAALIKDAELARSSGRNQQLRYGKGSPFIDIRLPCNGGIDFYIDARPDRAIIAEAINVIEQRAAVALSFGVGSEGGDWRIEHDAHAQITQHDAARNRFTRVYHPAPRVLLFGKGPDVNVLARLADSWGCDVECIAPDDFTKRKPQLAVDAYSAIICLFHEHEYEDEVLRWALGTRAFYIGALGGEKATARRQEALAAMGFSAHDRARVRGPVGLIPVAKDAQMLALSILAEVIECYGRITGRLGAR
jgi:xanthine dehydrogenase accessory factor